MKNFKDSTEGNTVFQFERDGTNGGGNKFRISLE
jgi:hypothetical protein